MSAVDTIVPDELIDVGWGKLLLSDVTGASDLVIVGEVDHEPDVGGYRRYQRFGVGVKVDVVERGLDDNGLAELEGLDVEVVLCLPCSATTSTLLMSPCSGSGAAGRSMLISISISISISYSSFMMLSRCPETIGAKNNDRGWIS
jgi:hypothetical protein